MFLSCGTLRPTLVSRRSAFSLLSASATLLALNCLLFAKEVDHERKVIGYQQCMDCHELPVEAWMRSGHSRRSLEILDSNLRAIRYAERLGMDSKKLAIESTCVQCHGTQQNLGHGLTNVLGGVSCESCHGPAGPSLTGEGWYEFHSGEESLPEDSQVDLETYLKNSGMARTDDLYLLAVRCYTCHSVSNQEVVRAGHVAGTQEFEITSWFSGEVRHNFAPYTVDVEDEELNATVSNLWLANHSVHEPKARLRLMFIIGVMADLEVNLRNRANATEAGSFATAAAGRVSAAHIRLRQIAQRLKDAELAALADELDSIRSLLFQPPLTVHTLSLLKTAQKVARTAKDFLKANSGENLSGIDDMISAEAKGQEFQP